MATTTGDTVNGPFGDLDFTELPYVQGTAANYNPTTDVLTVTSVITGNSLTESLTLNNPGTTSFVPISDGKTGTEVGGVGSGTIAIGNPPVGAAATASPSDAASRLTFNNAQLAASGGAVGTLSGSANLDYTTGTSQGVFTFSSGGQTETFSNPSVVATSANSYFVFGSGTNNQYDDIGLFFNGQQPTSTNSVDVEIGGTGPGADNGGTSYEGTPAVSSSTVCFASGTSIRTVAGDVPVERLAVGDLVITASGARRPIRWLGHRTVDCRRHPQPREAMPMRVAASAFGPDRPARDLRVSPGHAICVDLLGEVLIPVGALVNGTTITQEDVDSVTYWHVELDSHDILLAENLPCESYLEMGNRGFFAQSAVVERDASPDAPVSTHADFCRPYHDGGVLVEAVRAQLRVQAERLGWRLEDGGMGDLHLLVDGRRLAPELRDLSARWTLPAEAREVWLVSRTSVPADIGLSADPRTLGVHVGGLTIDDGFGAPRHIGADDERLCCGFHAVEPGPQRWTAGRARLPADLWARLAGNLFLRVDLSRPALPRWVAPAAPAIPLSLVA